MKTIFKNKIFLILIVLFVSKGYAQNLETADKNFQSGSSTLDIMSKFYNPNLSDKLDKSVSSTPMDGSINPDEYLMGPNDILEINIFGGLSQTYSVKVSPEVTVIIPGISEISLKELNLTKSKSKIIEEIKKKYKTKDIFVTLRSPRQFIVHVTGYFEPGNYIVSSLDRLDNVVYLSYKKLVNVKVEQQEIKQEVTKEKQDYKIKAEILMPEYFQKFPYFKVQKPSKDNTFSLRNIKILRKNGDTINVDLLRYYSTGDVKYNPHMQDGDVIFVPSEDITGNSIIVSGSVNQGGKFEYSQNDSLTTAIALAQGTTSQADLKNVELTFFREDRKSFETKVIDAESIFQKKSPDIKLNPGDQVYIRDQKRDFEFRSVNVRGEVVKPGTYPIVKGVTKLSEIIKRAGGFTGNADLYEAKIIRNDQIPVNIYGDFKNYPDYMKLRNSRLGPLDKIEAEYFGIEEKIKADFVVADFKKLFIENDSNADITLEGDENIIIPLTINSVCVSGQVVSSGYVNFVEGKDMEYYIKKAGGLGESAKTSDIKIIKAGSKNWVDPGSTKIEKGDIIWVPKIFYKDFDSSFEIYRDIASVVISIGTLAVLILQISK
jgi:polysaccharide biosynthesis/export protein